jgi:hypothetical protein
MSRPHAPMRPGQPKCPSPWCQEAGQHERHRRYVTSLLVPGGLIGVNVIESKGVCVVELTVTRGESAVVVPMPVAEAGKLSRAVRTAAFIAARRASALKKS